MKKIQYGFFLLLFLSATADAQVKKGLKLLEKKQYEKAILAFEADLSNPKEQTAAEFSLSQIYGNPKLEKPELVDLDKGFDFANKAIASSAKADAATKKKLNERRMGLQTMRSWRDKIVTAALDKAGKENSSAAFNHFLQTYKDINKPHIQKANNSRNQLAFNEAKAMKTGSAMENFWRLYSESCQTYSPDLYKIAEKELMEAYIRQNDWSSYPDFAAKYPENIYVKDSAAAVKMQVSAMKNTIPAYKSFLEGYPNSPFAKIAIDSIYALTLQENSLEHYDYFVRTYPNYPALGEVWKAFYKSYCQSNTCPADFYKAYPNAPKKIE